MRKKTREKIKLAVLWAVAVLVLAGAVVSVLTLNKKPKEYAITADENALNDGEESGTPDTGYAKETSYSGQGYVPASLFKYPFKKTGDYMMNKDYINDITVLEANALSDKVESMVKDIYTINYQSTEEETYKQILESYNPPLTYVFFQDGTMAESTEDAAEKVLQFAKDNELVMEAKGYSNSCMVFHDMSCDIVRVKATFAVYSCKDLDLLKKNLGVSDITLGEPFSVIYDVYMSPDVYVYDRSDYKATIIEKIG